MQWVYTDQSTNGRTLIKCGLTFIFGYSISKAEKNSFPNYHTTWSHRIHEAVSVSPQKNVHTRLRPYLHLEFLNSQNLCRAKLPSFQRLNFAVVGVIRTAHIESLAFLLMLFFDVHINAGKMNAKCCLHEQRAELE